MTRQRTPAWYSLPKEKLVGRRVVTLCALYGDDWTAPQGAMLTITGKYAGLTLRDRHGHVFEHIHAASVQLVSDLQEAVS